MPPLSICQARLPAGFAAGGIVETEGGGLFAVFGDAAAVAAGCLQAWLETPGMTGPPGWSCGRMGINATRPRRPAAATWHSGAPGLRATWRVAVALLELLGSQGRTQRLDRPGGRAR